MFKTRVAAGMTAHDVTLPATPRQTVSLMCR